MLTAADLINSARRPVIYAGGGVVASNAADELLAVAEKMQIPVTTTLMGMGAFSGYHHLYLGMLGMHGTRYANYAIGECDVLLAIGVRFDDRVTGKIAEFAPHAKVIHMDIDAAEIGKNVCVDVPIVGDVKEIYRDCCRASFLQEIFGNGMKPLKDGKTKTRFPMQAQLKAAFRHNISLKKLVI